MYFYSSSTIIKKFVPGPNIRWLEASRHQDFEAIKQAVLSAHAHRCTGQIGTLVYNIYI